MILQKKFVLSKHQNKAEFKDLDDSEAQYTNKTVMRIGGLILNSTKFFPLFESADVLALPNSSLLGTFKKCNVRLYSI